MNKSLTGGTHHPSFFFLWRQWQHCRHDRHRRGASTTAPSRLAPLLEDKDRPRDHLLLLPSFFPPCRNPSRQPAMAVT